MKHLKLRHGYVSLKMKYQREEFPMLHYVMLVGRNVPPKIKVSLISSKLFKWLHFCIKNLY